MARLASGRPPHRSSDAITDSPGSDPPVVENIEGDVTHDLCGSPRESPPRGAVLLDRLFAQRRHASDRSSARDMPAGLWMSMGFSSGGESPYRRDRRRPAGGGSRRLIRRRAGVQGVMGPPDGAIRQLLCRIGSSLSTGSATRTFQHPDGFVDGAAELCLPASLKRRPGPVMVCGITQSAISVMIIDVVGNDLGNGGHLFIAEKFHQRAVHHAIPAAQRDCDVADWQTPSGTYGLFNRSRCDRWMGRNGHIVQHMAPVASTSPPIRYDDRLSFREGRAEGYCPCSRGLWFRRRSGCVKAP